MGTAWFVYPSLDGVDCSDSNERKTTSLAYQLMTSGRALKYAVRIRLQEISRAEISSAHPRNGCISGGVLALCATPLRRLAHLELVRSDLPNSSARTYPCSGLIRRADGKRPLIARAPWPRDPDRAVARDLFGSHLPRPGAATRRAVRINVRYGVVRVKVIDPALPIDLHLPAARELLTDGLFVSADEYGPIAGRPFLSSLGLRDTVAPSFPALPSTLSKVIFPATATGSLATMK